MPTYDLLTAPEIAQEFRYQRSWLADGWLAGQVEAGRCELNLRPRQETCVLHGHCHQKALVGTGGTAAALRLVPQHRARRPLGKLLALQLRQR